MEEDKENESEPVKSGEYFAKDHKNFHSLNLNNRKLSKIEISPEYKNIQHLSACYNSIVKIQALDSFLNLKVLELKNNSIFKITGLSSLQFLEVLDLSGNSISSITGLEGNFNLKFLDLSFNSICSLGDLSHLTFLSTLLLSGNFISHFENAQVFVPPQIQTFSIESNEIVDINEFIHLQFLVQLTSLFVKENPCTKSLSKSVCKFYFLTFPSLKYLDIAPSNVENPLKNASPPKPMNAKENAGTAQDSSFDRPPLSWNSLQQLSKEETTPEFSFERFFPHHAWNHSHQKSDNLEISSLSHHPSNLYTSDPLEESLLESTSEYISVEDPPSPRSILAWAEKMEDQRISACIKIQSFYRGFSERQKTLQRLVIHKSAVIIQAVWRGYVCRHLNRKVVRIRQEMRLQRTESYIKHLMKSVNTLKNELEEEKKRKLLQDQTIHYLWSEVNSLRKAFDQEEMKRKNKACVVIQKYWKGFIVRKKLL